MNIPYFSLRLSTVACFFLPFIFFLSTCTDSLTSREAFNKKDALQNIKEKNEYKFSQLESIIRTIDSNKNKTEEILAEAKAKFISTNDEANFDRNLESRIICPTTYSLSGIGSIIYHKNILGQVTIALSLLLSLLTLILWRLLTKRKLALLFISINVFAILVFEINNIIVGVTTLFGTWTLLFLLIAQLLTEVQLLKSNNKTDTKV
jgi:hypothetical protein